ncbi:PLP-dependent aminotransferase family protein [Kitasatospora sp. NPDC059673]|uniref:MocR-like pyridoxine biosynthesis transcription factor PdxR n=1 Tax=Kitasatospora sp. NPDC059673 TaxID=3346901 RepID=UPI0036A296F5
MAEAWVNSSVGSPSESPVESSADFPSVAPAGPLGTDLFLELSGRGSRRAQLMQALREAVDSGRLAPGTRLPPYRSLARDLGIARNTVADAYAELVAEGRLSARQGSGTRVAHRAAPLPTGRDALVRRTAARPVVHDLMPSSPDASTFPRADWLASARRAVSAAPNDAFGVGDPRGRPELRTALAEYLARSRGVRTDPDRIVVCAGFAHALRLLGGILDGPVAVEAYGLAFHRGLLTEAGRRTLPIGVDRAGARTAELAATDARAALLTPAHQFPTGGPLHAERRALAVDWARAHGGLLLEDDYDGEFRYDRQPIGAVQGLDPEHVVYLGSTSKSLSPALRLGWMVLPAALVEPVLAAKGARELTSGVIDQLTLADFLAHGAYDRHLRRMRRRYRHRRDLMVRTLADRTPDIRVSGIAAGLHAVLELPEHTEPLALGTARRLGLALEGLRAYRHPDSTMPLLDGLVIGYATPPDHAFPAALDALCQALTALPRG